MRTHGTTERVAGATLCGKRFGGAAMPEAFVTRLVEYVECRVCREKVAKAQGVAGVAEIVAAYEAKAQQGEWFPACGGTETPFTTRTGRRLLYVWQPTTGRHAYLDLGTDLILSDADAALALGKD